MTPTILTIAEKKLIGIKSKMYRHEHQNIPVLWKQFMPRVKAIENRVNTEYIALQEYISPHVKDPFDIWASVEVSDHNTIPEHMQPFTIASGLYAIFVHKGMDAGKTYKMILEDWLPQSEYQIDSRPHFQVMGERYSNGSADSEEDFYVPIAPIKN